MGKQNTAKTIRQDDPVFVEIAEALVELFRRTERLAEVSASMALVLKGSGLLDLDPETGDIIVNPAPEIVLPAGVDAQE